MDIDQLVKLIRMSCAEKTLALYFVRHGQSTGNALHAGCLVNNDDPLTEQGVTEAASIATHFKKADLKAAAIYSSPLQRTQSTAKPLADVLELPVVVIENLRERRWGEWGGWVWTDVSAQLENMTLDQRYTFVPPGNNGESWQQMEVRLLKAVGDAVAAAPAKSGIVFVTHHGCLRCILPMLAGEGRAAHAQFSVKTGTVTRFADNKVTLDIAAQ
ncbi:MAG: histidine phosphatase family protein [Bdellovibrionales bacterium]